MERSLLEGQKIPSLVPRSLGEHPKTDLDGRRRRRSVRVGEKKHLTKTWCANRNSDNEAAHLVVQHGFGRVGHDALGVAGLLAVDEDDAAQPADEAHRAGVDQLLLGDHGAAVREDLHQAWRGGESASQCGRFSSTGDDVLLARLLLLSA